MERIQGRIPAEHARPGSAVPPGGARKDLAKACEEFESVFVHTMLKEMDKSVSREDGLFQQSGAEEIFREMFYQEMSRDIAAKRSLGIADMLENQIGKQIDSDNNK